MKDTVINLYIEDVEMGVKLKKMGFDDPCSARFFGKKITRNTLGHWYKHNSGEIDKRFISCPTIQQVEDWLEREYEIFICLEQGVNIDGRFKHDYAVWGKIHTSGKGFTNRKKAKLAALSATLNLLEKKNFSN